MANKQKKQDLIEFYHRFLGFYKDDPFLLDSNSKELYAELTEEEIKHFNKFKPNKKDIDNE